MGRPRKYADDAARQAAYRERYAVIETRVEKETAETLQKIADYLDVPRTEVIASLLKFALLNRNWLQLGLFGKRFAARAIYADAKGNRQCQLTVFLINKSIQKRFTLIF